MNEELYYKIINNAKETLSKDTLSIISKFGYKEIGEYYFIGVYVKEDVKAKQLGEILVNIETYAKESGANILIDFLRG